MSQTNERPIKRATLVIPRGEDNDPIYDEFGGVWLTQNRNEGIRVKKKMTLLPGDLIILNDINWQEYDARRRANSAGSETVQ